MNLFTISIYFAATTILAMASGRRHGSPVYKLRDLQAARSESDLETSPTNGLNYRKNPGRVVIKVFRGPDDGDYAPHGYWVRQPADDRY